MLSLCHSRASSPSCDQLGDREPENSYQDQAAGAPPGVIRRDPPEAQVDPSRHFPGPGHPAHLVTSPKRSLLKPCPVPPYSPGQVCPGSPFRPPVRVSRSDRKVLDLLLIPQ